MFKKLVAIEPTHIVPEAEVKLHEYAEEVVLYDDIPQGDMQIAERIGDADAVLLSSTSRISGEIWAQCPNVKYVGMCCSLYSPESANVDINYANAHGITVKGIRDYGDEGVVEYVVSELVRILHGYGCEPWFGKPREITGLKVGIVGLGKSGGMIADAMNFFGAQISYFARSEKPQAAAKGYKFQNLNDLLRESEVVLCCLNKNTVLLHQEQFDNLGNHKVLFNTGLSPAWDAESFAKWLDGDNICCTDTKGALGAQFTEHPHARCMNASSGLSAQAFVRLSEKVLGNIEDYLKTL